MGTRQQASYDLHLHTCWSYDATAGPEHYFRRAAELGMRCLAVTEHHVLDSQEEVRAAAAAYAQIRVIPAAELSVTTSLGPVDLLCYSFPDLLPRPMQRVLDAYHKWQRDCGQAIVEGMGKLGWGYSHEDREALLRSYRPARTIDVQGLTHVSNSVQRRYFLQRGFIAADSEYDALLRRLRQETHLPPYPKVDQVVPAVHSAGAVIAIAHPAGYFQGADPARMEQLREECRLDGIECAHPATPLELTGPYRRYCLDHGLFSVAGTDCHSDEDIDSQLGCHGGQEEWLEEFLERLG
jgi:predicted metal-dependent phosphoesterase TrpH